MHNAQFRCLSNHLYTNVPGCLYINVHSDRSIDRPSSKCEWRSSKRECCRRKRKFMGNGIPKKSWRSQGCIRSNLMALIINTILFGNIIVQLDWKWDCILYHETTLVHHISFLRPQPRQSVQSIIEFCSRFPQALTRTVGWMWWVFSPSCCETHWWWNKSHSYIPNIFEWQHVRSLKD